MCTNLEIYFRLDTWSNLSLAMYLDPQDYQLLMETVHEVKGVLHDIFNGFINEKAIQKRSLSVSFITLFLVGISKTPQKFFSDHWNWMVRIGRWNWEIHTILAWGGINNGMVCFCLNVSQLHNTLENSWWIFALCFSIESIQNGKNPLIAPGCGKVGT